MKMSVGSFKQVLIHLAIMLVVGLSAWFYFFHHYLPDVTQQGQTITVPNLQGITYSELDEYLTARNLRYEVQDSSYSSEFPPLTVMKQHPKPGAQVKENRKIFISVNATSPPNVKMPRLLDTSVKNAQLVLRSYGLELGNITYKPDLAANAVLEQLYRGKPIPEGTQVPKGTKIDLVVGDGKGNRSFESPNLLGMDIEEARFTAVGSGLQVGELIYESAEDKAPNTVLRQIPPAGARVQVGDIIDLVVVEFDENSIPSLNGNQEE